MKSSNVQRMPASFANHVNLGALVGLCVDDLIVALDNQDEKFVKIDISVEQKGLRAGDTTWTITATADTEKK